MALMSLRPTSPLSRDGSQAESWGHRPALRRLAGWPVPGAACLFLLIGCATGSDLTASQTETSTSVASPTVSDEPAITVSPMPPVPSDELQQAVQGYSDAFLGAQPVEAYEYFSARCTDRVSLSYFTGIVIAAKDIHGEPLTITTYDAEVAGDLARVTYTYDVPALSQMREPWSRENGVWKLDDC